MGSMCDEPIWLKQAECQSVCSGRLTRHSSVPAIESFLAGAGQLPVGVCSNRRCCPLPDTQFAFCIEAPAIGIPYASLFVVIHNV